jgi:hypothetical protein
MKTNALLFAGTACALAAGCSATTTTRVVEPTPAAATQRTVYPDGTYSDRTVVPATTTVVPAGTTTTYVQPRTTTVYTTR